MIDHCCCFFMYNNEMSTWNVLLNLSAVQMAQKEKEAEARTEQFQSQVSNLADKLKSLEGKV